MEIMQISNEIQKKINQLDEMRGVVKERGEEAALRTSLYEKALAVTIIQLRNGKTFIFEGETIEAPPVTLIEKMARGIIFADKLAMDKAAALYKSAIININTVEAQLNALQSLFRHLERA